jgi:hypothetical protein
MMNWDFEKHSCVLVKVLSRNLLGVADEKPWNTAVEITYVPVEIQTEYVSNVGLNYGQLLVMYSVIITVIIIITIIIIIIIIISLEIHHFDWRQ